MNKKIQIITLLLALIAAGCSLCAFIFVAEAKDRHRNTTRYLSHEIDEAQRDVICALERDIENIYMKDIQESIKSLQSSLGVSNKEQTLDDELNEIKQSIRTIKDDVAEIKEILDEIRPKSGPAFEPLLPQRTR